MHEMVVVQPLSAIARTNSPKPSSSAWVHSVFLMRQGPGSANPQFEGIVRDGIAIGVDCESFFWIVVQPDNAAPSAATKTNAFTVSPTLAERDSRWKRRQATSRRKRGPSTYANRLIEFKDLA